MRDTVPARRAAGDRLGPARARVLRCWRGARVPALPSPTDPDSTHPTSPPVCRRSRRRAGARVPPQIRTAAELLPQHVMWKARGYCAIPFAALTLPANALVRCPRRNPLAHRHRLLPWRLPGGVVPDRTGAVRPVLAAARCVDAACGGIGRKGIE